MTRIPSHSWTGITQPTLHTEREGERAETHQYDLHWPWTTPAPDQGELFAVMNTYQAEQPPHNVCRSTIPFGKSQFHQL